MSTEALTFVRDTSFVSVSVTRHSYISCVVGPIVLKFFVNTHGWPGGVIG